MHRIANTLRSTRPRLGASAVLVALLAITAVACDDGNNPGADSDAADTVAGSADGDDVPSPTPAPTLTSPTSPTTAPPETAAVANLDDWCAVVREVDFILGDASLDGPLEEVQRTHADVMALSDQLVAGVNVVDAEYRDDVLKVIDGQRMLSQLVMDATDSATMRADFEAAMAETFVVAEGTYEWVGSTCGLDEGSEETSSDAPSVPAASHGDVRLIVDQSPTVSDIGALGFLVARPDVELLAVTMPGTGESDCSPGAVTTQAVLDAAGQGDVPLGCGGVPLDGTNEWPTEWRSAADALAEVVAPGTDEQSYYDAESVLIETLTAAETPVTILALGPLTNIAAVLETDKSLADKIERIVVMGGAVAVDGNVEPAWSAEWNFHAHPAAAQAVLGSGVPIALVPLDATDHVALTAEHVAGVASIGNALARVQAAVYSSLGSLDFMFMWDELAAVLTVQPEAGSWSERSIVVEADGSTIESPDGYLVQVATDADAASVRSILLGALNEFGD